MASRCSSPPTESTTSLFAIPGYSKLGQMPPGSSRTLVKELYLRGHVWHVKVSPCGFHKGVPDYVAVTVSTRLGHSAAGTNISIEILDDTWERTAFCEEQVLGSDTWFKSLVVKRSELEAESCVHNDNIPVRCTLTFLDVEKQRRQRRAAARGEWWRRLKRSFVLPKSSDVRSTISESNTDEVSPATEEQHEPKLKHPVIPEAPASTDGSFYPTTASFSSPTMACHVIRVPRFSQLVKMSPASALTLQTFRFRENGWSVVLYPNGFSETTAADTISIMVVNNTPTRHPVSGTEISIGILDKNCKRAVFHNKQTLADADGTLWFKFLTVEKTKLEASSCLSNDSFTVTCNLTFPDREQQETMVEEMVPCPRTADESDSVLTPLLSTMALVSLKNKVSSP